ncbi:UTP--glucose-1-phosphate uridylyltransferase [Dorcoceras hygrometricum]|uniref:UTP--glucose-1-phosphate uridylyltransferase n=1 Tax=Dorcoceras hygrometricum TaxID=472368 RepID=A0A2Z7AVD0_9LAMI|nr:UTP--glucose-1-phosphate uridylyltransferase [Dorcoceras hygrometricum]
MNAEGAFVNSNGITKLIMAIASPESCLVDIGLFKLQLVVSRLEIYLRKYRCPLKLIKKNPQSMAKDTYFSLSTCSILCSLCTASYFHLFLHEQHWCVPRGETEAYEDLI